MFQCEGNLDFYSEMQQIHSPNKLNKTINLSTYISETNSTTSTKTYTSTFTTPSTTKQTSGTPMKIATSTKMTSMTTAFSSKGIGIKCILTCPVSACKLFFDCSM